MSKILILSLALCGCAALGGTPGDPPECAPALLARMAASEAAEVLAACDGVSELECAEARSAIRVRYTARRDAWVHCGEKGSE